MKASIPAPPQVLRFGGAVSLVQSALFVVIGVAALVLGVGHLVADGFAALPASNPVAFRVLCVAFTGVAVLGLAITPAERAAVNANHPDWAGFGSALAYLGHAGTIAYFSWWLVITRDPVPAGAAALAPLQWGAMFELVFVGAWVWIIAAAIRDDPRWPRGFLMLSVVKATSFWLAYLAILHHQVWSMVIGVGVVTFVTGPSWHAWIAVILRRLAEEETQ